MYLEELLKIFAAVAILSAFFGWSMNNLVNIFTSLFIGGVLSALASNLVEAFTGGVFKNFLLVIEIRGVKFSFTFFVIASFIVKLLFFS